MGTTGAGARMMVGVRDTPNVTSSSRIAGVDGCRGGWVVASERGIEVVPTLAPLLERFDLVGVDMPIGLPSEWGRAADAEARRFLPGRGATVFPVPPRPLLAHRTYAEANAASRAAYGKGLTRQTWNLFPKLREVDALPTDALRRRVVEIHPECAFARLTGAPLPPKRTAEGRTARRAIVADALGLVPTRLRGAEEHDVLDACAVLWSARRHAAGGAVTFGDGTVDERGLPMRIVS